VAAAITLARAGSARSWTVCALSLVLGLVGIATFVFGGSVLLLVLGIALLVVGGLLLLASRAANDVLVVDDDAVARDLARQNQWRLRWAHMAAVRFAGDALLLVPLPEVAGHPEIAPALEERDVDGTRTPTFCVPLGAHTLAAARAAITEHAPPHLLAQSSPRPPST
jgi:hypothetical protein